jgi:hypothetical protein
MTTYITTIGSGKLKNLLTKLKKEDSLVIFHSADEKQIPIDMISMFANAKGTVEFKEAGDDIETAFMLGKLSANPRTTIEITGDLPIFNKLNELLGVKKKAAAHSSKAASSIAPADKTTASKSESSNSKASANKKSASSGN